MKKFLNNSQFHTIDNVEYKNNQVFLPPLAIFDEFNNVGVLSVFTYEKYSNRHKASN